MTTRTAPGERFDDGHANAKPPNHLQRRDRRCGDARCELKSNHHNPIDTVPDRLLDCVSKRSRLRGVGVVLRDDDVVR